jgi:UTP-glucose-1-phosphate uridylyltransferase
MEQKNSDFYESQLEECLKKLEECQQEKNLESCFVCNNTFDCKIREDYVKAVYESMNHGKGGGFEF